MCSQDEAVSVSPFGQRSDIPAQLWVTGDDPTLLTLCAPVVCPILDSQVTEAYDVLHAMPLAKGDGVCLCVCVCVCVCVWCVVCLRALCVSV